MNEIKDRSIVINDDDELLILKKHKENNEQVTQKKQPTKNLTKIQKRKIDFEESYSIGD